MSQIVLGLGADHMGRFLPGLDSMKRAQEKSPHCNHRHIADTEMLLCAVVDRTHGFRRAGIMDEKNCPHAGKVLLFLLLSVLQIVIPQIAPLMKIRPDLLIVLAFVIVNGTIAAKVNVVAHATSVVDRHMGMNRVAFRIAFQTAGGNKSMTW